MGAWAVAWHVQPLYSGAVPQDWYMSWLITRAAGRPPLGARSTAHWSPDPPQLHPPLIPPCASSPCLAGSHARACSSNWHTRSSAEKLDMVEMAVLSRQPKGAGTHGFTTLVPTRLSRIALLDCLRRSCSHGAYHASLHLHLQTELFHYTSPSCLHHGISAYSALQQGDK